MGRSWSTRCRGTGVGRWVVLGALGSGCVGQVREDPRIVPGDDGSVPDGPSVGDDAGALPPECAAGMISATPSMRRLTNAEYQHTARDLLLEPGASDIVASFPEDSATGGFDNNVDALHISTQGAQRYEDAAEQLASNVLGDATRRAQVVGCDASSGDACLTLFVQRFGRRAFRRPLTDAEVASFVALAHTASGDPHPQDSELGMVIRAMLQSPHFLFRVEAGVPDATRPGVNRLTGYEMATRLSYTLWGSTPDDALLDAAQSGALDTGEGVAARARTMLGDPRAHESVQHFYEQWLQLDQFPGTQIDPSLFPAWNDALRDSMTEETHRFVDGLIWTDGASLLDLLTARYSFVDARLAALYGLTPPPGSGFARVEFAADSPRGGILAQGSYLTLTSSPNEASPIHRGEWVRGQLLCTQIPAPPPDVPPLPPPVAGQTQRERLASHRSVASCAGCHDLMDPVGFGLERFDAIGAYGTTDSEGRPLTGAGQLNGFDPPDFVGPAQLAQRLHDAPEVPQCMVTQTFRFAYGRVEGDDDACAIALADQAFRTTNYSFRDMLVSMVSSDAFRFVRPAATGGGM